ncbi:ABC transporter permease [Candidatus Berkelbacteria bacterium]|nr:ABC transporter permease [Candidatus Berkelbacteria bacterium]
MSLRSLGRVLRFGLMNVLRNGWFSIASIIVITITLFIIGVFAIQSFVIVGTTQGIQDKLDLSVYFNDDVPEEDILAIRTAVANRPDVKSVDYISKERAFEIWQERRTSERVKSLVTPEDNPLPRSLVIHAYDPGKLGTLAKLFERDQYQEQVRRVSYRDNQSVIESLVATARSVRQSGWILAAIFFFLSFVLIYNMTRVIILSRAHEIEIMRLVGSTTTFVRAPYLVEAAVIGFVGALLALGAVYLFLRYDLASATPLLSIAKFLAPDMLEFFWSNLVTITIVTLLLGIGSTVFMSSVAVRRFVKF